MESSKPVRRIFEAADLAVFKQSIACCDILSFVKLCADAVVGKTVSEYETDTSCPVMVRFVEWMADLRGLVDSTPPLKQPMRFGNKAFRLWHAQVVEKEIPRFLSQLGGSSSNPLQDDAAAELGAYLAGAFGNETRIDYGTGHELFILIFFQCLVKLELVSTQDCACIVLQGFAAYMQTMRKLQETYLLEPAGSHGVWGLDDYHCLAFLFGAAQLVKHNTIVPSSIHDLALLEELHHDYLYLSCIRVIRKTKVGAPFSETSPMLHDISGMTDWMKVCAGLLRLFQGEVLFKLPVVQHLIFGSLLSMDPLPTATPPTATAPEKTATTATTLTAATAATASTAVATATTATDSVFVASAAGNQ